MAFRFTRAVWARSFFPLRSCAAVLFTGMVLSPLSLSAAQQEPQQTPAPATTEQAPSSQQAPASTPNDLPAGTTSGAPQDNVPTAVLSNKSSRKKTRKSADEAEAAKQQKKDEKVVQSKDTVKEQREMKRRMKDNPLANVNSAQPDKQLYDRALVALKKGRFDVSRLLLQDMLATYPDSEYQMRAKLAFADSWYREGGTAALTQAETEYHDFIIFFPNAPEAAEAQMRIGDIYFKQMDKPDRDYSKAVHAQEEYRNMMTQYPDSKLIPEAKQKLRETQEILATRETGIADFYLSHENYAAAIARYQTVVDTYPLFSKIDSALIGLGDAYAQQAKFVRTSPTMKNLSEDQRARLLRVYDSQAAAAYGRVVTVYSASPRVEDARDRLEAIGAPIPEPTADQLAASQALENSRQSYNLGNRAKLLIMRSPDVVQASRIGEPSLADPKATYAPAVSKKIQEDFTAAMTGKDAPAKPAASGESATPTDSNTDAAPSSANAPAALADIPAADGGTASGASSTATITETTPAGATTSTGTGMGVTIITPGATDLKNANNGLNSIGPANNAALPPIEKPASAPDAVNDVSGVKTPVGQQPPQPNANGKVKNPKPEYEGDVESSSTHKKKKGIKKINPF